jgi:hypothetical protein
MYLKSLKFITPNIDKNGIQVRINFVNNWGVSVIKHKYSYGNSEDLWELGILYKDKLYSQNPLSAEVLGHLTDDEVNEYIDIISSWSDILSLENNI